MTVWRLRGAIRPYAWGSRSFLASLQGRPVPSVGPEAELWLGAHPSDPATVQRPTGPVSLAAVIAEDPADVLGPAVAGRFGPRLPFLLKILAAAAPLSLQAHPDAERAREAFAAGHPGYVDECHKPELLVALTPFDALCGFRDPDMSAAVLEALDLPELAPVVAQLRAGVAGLRPAVRTLLTWPEPRRRDLLDAVVEAVSATGPRHPYARSFALIRELAAYYPADPGVLVAVLLNQVRFAPGEAIWMPAGNLHAYLCGAGVEIMAASDNVLRGGLTPKHVDVPELLRVLRFEMLESPVLTPVEVGPGVVTWPASAPEFTLHRVTVDGEGGAVESDGADGATPVPAAGGAVMVPAAGPRVVVCVRGEVIATDGGGDAVPISSGGAAFVTADGGPLTIAGRGEAFVASVGG